MHPRCTHGHLVVLGTKLLTTNLLHVGGYDHEVTKGEGNHDVAIVKPAQPQVQKCMDMYR